MRRPKVIAGIGGLAETLEDRSIIIQAQRVAPGERVERLRLGRLGELEPLRQKCRRWADDHGDALSEADPAVPDLMSDRAADNWRPLLAIAELPPAGSGPNAPVAPPCRCVAFSTSLKAML